MNKRVHFLQNFIISLVFPSLPCFGKKSPPPKKKGHLNLRATLDRVGHPIKTTFYAQRNPSHLQRNNPKNLTTYAFFRLLNIVVTVLLAGRPRKRTSILGTTGDLCRFQTIQIASEAHRPSSSMAPGAERQARA